VADARERLAGFKLHRIESFESMEDAEESFARLIPPMRVAHTLGTPMLWCIASAAPAEDPGLMWILGLGAIGDASDHIQELGPLLRPSGAATAPVATDDMGRLLSGCEEWVAFDAVVMPKEESIVSDELRNAIFAQVAHGVFACVVHALPTPSAEIDAELLSLDQAARVGQLQGRAEFASSRTSSDLAIERYADLAIARQLGGWSVEIDVGARQGEAPVVAELVAAALGVPGLSFQLEGTSSFAVSEAWRQPRRRFLASTRQVAMIIRGPSRELPGVALRQQMPFDLNAESDATSGGDARQVDLGVTLDSALQSSGRFIVNASTLNRHALVCGATGSGKSQSVQQVLEQLTAIGVPWLVIEPAKHEYRSMHARLQQRGLDGSVHVIRLGDPDSPPLGINPLEPEQGFPLQTHVDMVAALFMASFDAAEPFPQILAEALRRCYSDLGWALAVGEYKRNEMGRPAARGQSYPRYPTLADLQRTARDVVHDVGYGQEVRDNVLGFVDVRLGSLRNGTPGRFFEGGHPLDLGALHRSNVVIEIEDVGNDLDKAFVIGTVVLRLYEHLRVNGPTLEKGLTHVTVVEEAHRLLRRSGPGARQNQAVELFAAMLSEVRAFGEGIIIAEQIPTKILPDVLKNTAVQIIHRLPSLEDRAVLAGTTNMDDDQSAFVLSLRPGYAAAFREGMDRPVLLKVDHPESLPAIESPVPQLGVLRQRLRGASCRETCQAEPCSARILEVGPQLARALPELPFWLELMFLAFVSETQIPRPGRVWCAALRNRLSDIPVTGCMLGAVVEATVSARWAQVGDFYDPTRLINAMTSTTQAMLFDLGPPASTNGFAAGRFVIRGVYDQLVKAGDAREPHPLTTTWREELGVDLLDASVPAQRAWLELGSSFSYQGHARLLAGIARPKAAGPASRIEDLALPLAGGVRGGPGVAAACRRVTPDGKEWVTRLSDWFGLTFEA
jgi:DNA helicase HerA-like ATPase